MKNQIWRALIRHVTKFSCTKSVVTLRNVFWANAFNAVRMHKTKGHKQLTRKRLDLCHSQKNSCTNFMEIIKFDKLYNIKRLNGINKITRNSKTRSTPSLRTQIHVTPFPQKHASRQITVRERLQIECKIA